MSSKPKRGMALIIVLGFILLLVIAAASFMLISLSEVKMVKRQNNSTKAFYLAEAGFQDIMNRLETDFSSYRDIISAVTVTENLGAGTYEVEIPPPVHIDGSNIYTFDITSKGTVDNVSRKIRQIIEVEIDEVWDFEDYVIYISGNIGDIDKESIINGGVYVNGDLTIGKDSYINGDVKTTGDITKEESVVITGDELPNSEPLATPTLDTTYYDTMIGVASGQEEGNQNISGAIPEVVYVNGQANITGDITGPGTIVATGRIVIDNELTIGDEVILIAGDSLDINKEYAIGEDCTLYSSTLVNISKEGSIGSPDKGSVIITPGDVSISKENNIYGLVFGIDDVSLDKECNVTGNVLGNAIGIIDKEGTYTLDKDLVDFSSIVGFEGNARIEATATPQTWEEVVPAI